MRSAVPVTTAKFQHPLAGRRTMFSAISWKSYFDYCVKNLRFFADWAAKKWPCRQQKSTVEGIRSEDLWLPRAL
jgi:hypothetical protein